LTTDAAAVRVELVEAFVALLLRHGPFDRLRANGVRVDMPDTVRAELVEAFVAVLLRHGPFDRLRANGYRGRSG